MDAKLKHLEFLQSVIARMATNSFLFKGWAITIAAGLTAFGVENGNAAILAIALGTTIMFWAMDGYYLWLERSFVTLYERVARTEPEAVDFSMRIEKAGAISIWFDTCWRHHLLLFYGTICATDVVGFFIVRTM